MLSIKIKESLINELKTANEMIKECIAIEDYKPLSEDFMRGFIYSFEIRINQKISIAEYNEIIKGVQK